MYMGDWENQRERILAHSLGRSMHRDFSMNLGNWLKTLQFPFWYMLGNAGFQGVDEGRTARTVTRSMLKKARIGMTN